MQCIRSSELKPPNNTMSRTVNHHSFLTVWSFFLPLHLISPLLFFFFLNDPAPTEIYTFPLHDALPISLVVDGVNRIQTQAVEVVFLEPVERVVDEELAHRRTVRSVKVDRGTPGGDVPLGEELRRVPVQVIALGAEVVVDHVEQHREAMPMRGRDQGLQLLRRTVRAEGPDRGPASAWPRAAARRGLQPLRSEEPTPELPSPAKP